MQHAPFTHTHSDEDEIVSIFMWSKVSSSERSIAERWRADGGETERRKAKGKGRKAVFQRVNTQIFPPQHSVSLHISPKCQGSGRQGLSGETTHTRLAFRKVALAVLVGVNGEVTHTHTYINSLTAAEIVFFSS